jgi:hypothetical protein
LTKKIEYGNGKNKKFALVDDDMFEELSKYKWMDSNGYPATMVFMHEMVIGKQPKGLDIDHINQQRDDNRSENLRTCTRSENLANRKKFSKGKNGIPSSKYKGVSKLGKKWIAQIGFAGIAIRLGRSRNEEYCARLYDQAAKMLYGECAGINFVNDYKEVVEREYLEKLINDKLHGKNKKRGRPRKKKETIVLNFFGVRKKTNLNKWTAKIKDPKTKEVILLGEFDDSITAAKVVDDYIIRNELEELYDKLNFKEN